MTWNSNIFHFGLGANSDTLPPYPDQPSAWERAKSEAAVELALGSPESIPHRSSSTGDHRSTIQAPSFAPPPSIGGALVCACRDINPKTVAPPHDFY